MSFRLRMSFDLALRHFQIDQLLDPEDVNTNRPDKKSILMYVMCLYHAIETRKCEQGSIQDLVQHYGSNEEIQLLDEKEMTEQQTRSDTENAEQNTITETFHSPFQQQQSTFHAGNITDLDEIPLARQISGDSSSSTSSDAVSSPGLQRSATFTIKKEIAQDIAVAMETANDQSVEPTKTADSQPAGSFYIESSSRPVSTATNASVEIGGYQNAIECVLTLLLEAEEVLSNDVQEVTELTDAKQQFQDHEEFMIKLSEYQQYVGGALEEGARLMTESHHTSGLTAEDQNEIKHQMFLLNERWETLRKRALHVQARIHSTLAKVQLEKIEDLRLLLTNTEDHISRMTAVGPSPKDIKRQIGEHKVLEKSLDDQKSLVDTLSNLVVIVNDDLFSELEDKLAALGERWSHVVKWTKTRWTVLQEAAFKWKQLTDRYAIVCRWMDARERDLKTMEVKEVTEIGSVMKRMNDLRYCDKDLDILAAYLVELEETAQSLGPGSQTLLQNFENLQDRYEALKLILGVQQSRIEAMGFKFPKSNRENQLERPDSWYDFQAKILRNELEPNESSDDAESAQPQSNKKRKLQKADCVKNFELKIEQMLEFVRECEENLDRVSTATLKQQSAILQQLSDELPSKTQDLTDLRTLLGECRAQPDAVLAPSEERRLSNITAKCDGLVRRIDELQTKHRCDVERENFYKSLTGFKLVLADCRDWYKQHSNSASRTDLESRLSYMRSLSPDIKAAQTVCQSDISADLIEWKQDFDQFAESWTDMKQALSRIIEQKTETTVADCVTAQEIANVSEILRRLEDFICETEEAYVVITNMQAMQENLERLTALQKRYAELKEAHDYVSDRISQSSANEDLMDVWAKLPNLLSERIIKQTTATENLNHFTDEYETIVQSMKNVEVDLREDVFILGEIKTLQRVSEKYEKYAKEIKKIEIDIISVKNFCEIIQKDGENDHKDYLIERIKNINNMYTKIIDLYQTNSKKLHQIIMQTEDVLQRVDQTQLWLNDLKMNTPTIVNSEIVNSNELFQIKTKFQSLKETCEQRTVAFRELNELGGEMLLQIDELIQQKSEKKYSYLAKQFTKLNAYWNQVTALVYNRTALLEHISSQLGEFKTFVVSETGYLDKLEKCLRKSPENAADAEEIYEELDVGVLTAKKWTKLSLVFVFFIF